MNAPLTQAVRQERKAYRRVMTVQSAIMKGLCVLFTAVILLILAFITFYLLAKGISYLSWDIFTQVPIPVGMEGSPGGLKNALVGTLILIALASIIGIPMGVLAGVYLSEYSSRSWLGTPARFIADVLTGVPSIVVGILGYELFVVPMGGFNGYAGAAALVHHDSDCGSNDRGDAAARAEQLSGCVDRARRDESPHNYAGGSARGWRKHHYGRYAGDCSRGRRNGAAAFYGAWFAVANARSIESFSVADGAGFHVSHRSATSSMSSTSLCPTTTRPT